MRDTQFDKPGLARFAGLMLGVMIGGTIGPVVFRVTGLNDPTASTLGALLGGVLCFVIVAAMQLAERYRRDNELYRAAQAVKSEAHLPETIGIRVDHGRLTLEGVVANEQERQRARETLETIPGIGGVVNRLRVRTPSGEMSTPPAEISRKIEQRLLRAAEEDAKGIHVVVDNTRVILEGRVRSWAEASAAEEAAWGIPGITEVENRLDIAA
jgi:osmotically-inducible protein OsmY